MTDREVFENPGPDFDGGMPSTGTFATDEAIVKAVAEAPGHFIGGVGRAMWQDASRFAGPSFDGSKDRARILRDFKPFWRIQCRFSDSIRRPDVISRTA